MKLFFLLCFSTLLSLGLAFTIYGKPHNHEENVGNQHPNLTGLLDRCNDQGFDAITLDHKGISYYLRDDYVWTGYHGPAEFVNKTWPGLPGHIDAAFRMHHLGNFQLHDHNFFFKDGEVWQFYGQRLIGQFPVEEKFPGIPVGLDAAVECPAGECLHGSVLFFKGGSVYLLDLLTRTVKEKHWPQLGPCTAVMRWLERYYCFQGVRFTRFNPMTGKVLKGYPKDARNYFMRCPGFGHGHRNNSSFYQKYNQCSNSSFDEFSADVSGRIYGFRDNWYYRVDSNRDGSHAWQINTTWPSLYGQINGVFTHNKNIYFIQGFQLYVYRAEAQYVLIEGYPKPVQNELGINGSQVDATFVCPQSPILHVVMGNRVRTVDLVQTPRVLHAGFPIGHPHVDAAMCTADGIFLFVGTKYYQYASVKQLAASTSLPEAHSIATNFMGCSQ